MEEVAKIIGGLIGAILFHALLSFVNSMVQLRQGKATAAANLNILKAEVKESHNAIVQTVDESLSGTRRDIKEAQQVMLDALSSTNTASSQVMSRQSELIDKYEGRISAMEQRNADADRRYGLMKTDFEKLLEENQQATKDRQEQQALAEKRDEELKTIQGKLKTMADEAARTAEELAKTKAEYAQLKLDYSQLQERIKALEIERDQERMASAEKIADLTNQLNDAKIREGEMQKKIDDYETRIKFLEGEVQRLSTPPAEPPKIEGSAPNA